MKYDVCCDEVHTYECKDDSEDGAIISFRRNVQRYKILMVKGVKEKC